MPKMVNKKDKGKKKYKRQKSLTPNILQLPHEILIKIFTYLTIEELKQASAVCSVFMVIANDPILLRSLLKRTLPATSTQFNALNPDIKVASLIFQIDKKLPKLLNAIQFLKEKTHSSGSRNTIDEDEQKTANLEVKFKTLYKRLTIIEEETGINVLNLFKQSTNVMQQTREDLLTTEKNIYNNKNLCCTTISTLFCTLLCCLSLLIGTVAFPYTLNTAGNFDMQCSSDDADLDQCKNSVKSILIAIKTGTICLGVTIGTIPFFANFLFDPSYYSSLRMKLPALTRGDQYKKLAAYVIFIAIKLFDWSSPFVGTGLTYHAFQTSQDIDIDNYIEWQDDDDIDHSQLKADLNHLKNNDIKFLMTGVMFLTYAFLMLFAHSPKIVNKIFEILISCVQLIFFSSTASSELSLADNEEIVTSTDTQSSLIGYSSNGLFRNTSSTEISPSINNTDDDVEAQETDYLSKEENDDIEIRIVASPTSTSNNGTTATEHTPLLSPSSTTSPQSRNSWCVVS